MESFQRFPISVNPPTAQENLLWETYLDRGPIWETSKPVPWNSAYPSHWIVITSHYSPTHFTTHIEDPTLQLPPKSKTDKLKEVVHQTLHIPEEKTEWAIQIASDWWGKWLDSRVNGWGLSVRFWVTGRWEDLPERRKRWGREYYGLKMREKCWKWRDERRTRKMCDPDRVVVRQMEEKEKWEKKCEELKGAEGWKWLVREFPVGDLGGGERVEDRLDD